AATHDIELTELLTPQFRNMHFSESVSQDGVRFDYQLKSGASNTRNAICLLDFYNYPPEVVAVAQRLADSAARC
ncbi:MAG: MutS family DNA mismatch repair protein, partial [Pygmaiobacter sp.]